MKSYKGHLLRSYPPWASSNKLVEKLFWRWIRPIRCERRADQPSNALDVLVKRRHGRGLFCKERTKAKQLFYWRFATKNSCNYMSKLERRINIEIYEAINCRNIEKAICHFRRYITFPFHDERNLLWGQVRLHEYDGDIESAIASLQCAAEKNISNDEFSEAMLCIMDLVRLNPDDPTYRGLLATCHLKEGSPRQAVNELQIQKRLYLQSKENSLAQQVFRKIVPIVDDLRHRGLLERQGPPPEEFTFDFDYDQQVHLDLDGIN